MSAKLFMDGTVMMGDRHTICKAFQTLQGAVPRAEMDALNAGVQYVRWFGVNTHHDFVNTRVTVVRTLHAMNVYLNGSKYINTVSVTNKSRSISGKGAYGFAWPDPGRDVTVKGLTFYIYLGAAWRGKLTVSREATYVPQVRSTQVQVLAHELSHHFGTNSNTGPLRAYAKEKYDDDALGLAVTDPLYAAHNADSYGYYIEEMS